MTVKGHPCLSRPKTSDTTGSINRYEDVGAGGEPRYTDDIHLEERHPGKGIITLDRDGNAYKIFTRDGQVVAEPV